MALVLTLFKNQWCASCKQVSPIIQQVAQQYPDKIKLAEVDIVAQPDLASQNEILSVPTLIISKDNHEVDRITGFISRDNLIKKLNL
ncbi:MAG: thioredoxin family protein [Planctomycetes bacterium]|nr:thioredoxin family protein [Planctomycetota bacterium]